MDKVTGVKIKYNNGTYSNEIPIVVSINNVELNNNHMLAQILGNIDVDTQGSIKNQLNKLRTNLINTYLNLKTIFENHGGMDAGIAILDQAILDLNTLG